MDPHLPPRSQFSFGTVLVNAGATEVLLREPTNHHNGYVWTFAKGMPEAGENPEDTALREAREEYGWDLEILKPIPRWFSGPQWANFFFLARAVAPRPDGHCWETASVKWFTWAAARDAISLTSKPHRRDRDHEILSAAQSVATGVNPLSPGSNTGGQP